MIRLRALLLTTFSAAALNFAPLALGQMGDAAESAPDFEQHAVIQRLDPASGQVFAGGQHYDIDSQTRIWIDDRPASRAELRPDMIGLRMGFSAYEDENRYPITEMHIFASEGRGSAAGEQ